MRYCVRCLQPDTRPQTKFSEEGVCPACVYYEEEQQIDFESRFLDLKELIQRFRKTNHAGFDCVLGVSGGKDSTRQALFLREKLGMKPLLVCLSYPPEHLTDRGANNLSNLINLGFDVEVRYPAPGIWRKLMKRSFLQASNWAISTELALFSAVPQAAIEHAIPLIFWGENPALQLGDVGTAGKTYWDGNNVTQMNTLASVTWRDYLPDVTNEKDLLPYIYPLERDFVDNKIQIIYLGVFWNNWSLRDNAFHSMLEGLEVRQDDVSKTGDLYGFTSLDEDWVTVNQMIKYYKYGFGRVTDYVNEDIRRKRISRQESVDIVVKWDGSCSDTYVSDFCEYLEITPEDFWQQVRSVTNTKLFELPSQGRPTPKFRVGIGI